ncbi:hypothetical protein LWI28_005215 [Acer negundo]|uniref:Uncharacterized protein n=1 Tax=Acer negundo TaxID=4023 RepID=A0AAD5ILL0_ACENE|nr:hypothetical protein LWI28_005215 [Acer negundo]
MGCLSKIQCNIRAASNGIVDLWEAGLRKDMMNMFQNVGSTLKLECLRGCPLPIQSNIRVIVIVLAKSTKPLTYNGFEEFRCMHSRRSLGRGLHPPREESSRVGRIAREFEEIPRQDMNMEGQEPRKEDETPPMEELAQETPTNQGQKMTMREYSLPAIGNQPSLIVLDPVVRGYELKTINVNLLPAFYVKLNDPNKVDNPKEETNGEEINGPTTKMLNLVTLNLPVICIKK